MIDNLTIAANGYFESTTLGRRNETGATEVRLSSMFGDLLHKSASSSAGDPAAVDAMAEPSDEPPTPAVRDTARREAPEDPDDFSDRGSRNDADTLRQTGREDIPLDANSDQPADVPEPDRNSGGRDEHGEAISKTGPEAADTAPAVGSDKVLADHHAAPGHANANASPLGTRGTIPTEPSDIATRNGTAPPVDSRVLKPAPDNPQRPQGTGSAQAAQAAQTATPAETTTAAQRQAGGLAKAVGNGGNIQVSVSVAKESETLVSQPSFNLASATAAIGEGGRPAPRANAWSGQADAPGGVTLHPNAARVQPQTAGAPQTPSPATAQAGTAAQAVPGTTAGLPAAFGETVDGDPMGLAGVTNTPRGTGPAAAQAGGAGKLAPHHRLVAGQISVNISKAVKAGMNRIEIQLRPESLGRVEVRLEVFNDGRVAAAVTVDNRDTLELLKSDARGLERALQDAGLKADSGNLSFSLRGHDTAARDEGGSAPRISGAETGDLEDGSEPSASPDATYPQGGIMPDGRIDIRA